VAAAPGQSVECGTARSIDAVVKSPPEHPECQFVVRSALPVSQEATVALTIRWKHALTKHTHRPG
jgi:hypothetical protein